MSKHCTLLIGLILMSSRVWAAEALPENIQRELASQADSIRREERERVEGSEEKPEINVEEKKEAAIAGEDEGPTFYVKKIRLEGNTVISTEVFSPSIVAFENRKTTFSHLRSLSQIITNIYRARGYLTSRAYLPPQTVEDGSVTIKVLEGKVGKIFIEGNRYFSENIYRKHMRFKQDGIFRYQDLEDSLYALHRRPDRKAKAYLISGEALGSSDIILKVSDKNPFHKRYSFSRRGTKLTHRSRHALEMTHNNFLGFDDLLSASLTLSEQGSYGAGSFYYDFPLENVPVSLTLSGGYTKTLLAKHLSRFEIKGESVVLSPSITYNFIQRREKTVGLSLGLDFVNSIALINDVQTSADRARTLRFGPRINLQDSGGRTGLNADVRMGLPGFLGGLEQNDPSASLDNTGDDYIYYTAGVFRLQRLPAGMYLLMRSNGQWTRDTLVATEQFRAGGENSVRGYPESDSGGDYGWASTAELTTPLFFLGKNWLVPGTDKFWHKSLRMAGFIDTAKTYLRERPSNTSVKDKFLLGAGVGLRFELEDWLSVRTDLGFPLGDDSADKNNPQIHLSVRGSF